MIRKLRIAVDHGNKNMKTCNQVFTTALITQDKNPFLWFDENDGDNAGAD